MRRAVLFFLILASVVGLTAAYFYSPSIDQQLKKVSSSNHPQTNQDLALAKDLLNVGRPEEALEIIQKHSDEIDNATADGRQWLELLIRTSEATLNTPQLVLLYEYYPKAFDSHEKAALLIANVYLAQGRSQDYQTLRGNWIGRETLPETWFVLDADKLLTENKRKEAIEFLGSRTFPGKADTGRLTRLSLLYVFDQPKTAWDYLTQAYAKDPENPEIRSYRAKLLEMVGKENLALSEYIAAAQVDPSNIYLKDQLAEFYLRSKQIPQALQLWVQNLKEPTLDFVWIKTLFWSKVAVPVAFDWRSATPPQGKLEPLVSYLLTLNNSAFWDNAAFDKVPGGQNYLTTQQSTFWLRLLEQLRQGKENEAYDLLQHNPFQAVSWNPSLEDALKKIILYRRTGQLGQEKAVAQANTKNAILPLFYRQLNELAENKAPLPADLQALLNGPEAFTAALLATSWNEAALQLHTMRFIPANYPEWVAIALTQALKQDRGVVPALEFASQQNQTPALSLIIGELLIAGHHPEAAISHLSNLTHENSEVGMRAAWLLSLIAMERGQFEEARAAIQAQPRLAQDVLGQETLAKIALLDGDTTLANQLYSNLEDSSTEAKSYLARKAFAEKDWKRARDLTEQLLRVYPNNSMLQDNLKRIFDEQDKLKRG